MPWQSDFTGMVFSWLALHGEPRAASALAAISEFNVGRYLNDQNGFCAAEAPGFYWHIAHADGQMITTWRDLFVRNFPQHVSTPCASIPASGLAIHSAGYAAVSRAMLASAANVGVSRAAEAYTRWRAMTPRMDATFASDPTWAIVPRTP
ncbi:hypothetical protein [Hydrogenophaga sp.]|uniref:hypothetical protein n=1 Tax=Hydrogenophaga sp. TaxID=1904254 RepID=UPI001994DCAF|nr:hypothetical protein [Hydrogenophaga sp.]MBD3892936.1 hypothetical protein [Hydrogenophaga sp.]